MTDTPYDDDSLSDDEWLAANSRRSDIDSFLNALDDSEALSNFEPSSAPRSPIPELVPQSNGEIRQAGAEAASTEFINGLRLEAERSLYFFTRAILGRTYLSIDLHGKRICPWLERVPPRRKLLLIPRFHCKSTLVSQALPIHILIQPISSNIYFPDESGSHQRIFVIGESDRIVQGHIDVARQAFESNALVRAFWHHLCYEKPSRDAPVWNKQEFTINRDTHFPEPSVRAIGVTARITGGHPTVLIKDDLIAEAAANSPSLMAAAIQSHRASRALIGRDNDLEFIIGTRWAAEDLYSHIIEEDPTVEVITMSAYEPDSDGINRPIYPEGCSSEKLESLRKTLGPQLFSLLMMNSEEDASINDFAGLPRRFFHFSDGELTFDEDINDERLYSLYDYPRMPAYEPGTPLSHAYSLIRNKPVEWHIT